MCLHIFAVRHLVIADLVDRQRESVYSSHTCLIDQKPGDIGAGVVTGRIGGVLGHDNCGEINVRVQDTFSVLAASEAARFRRARR